ncbi:MAG TPA: phosphoribosyltransferase family protein [Gammaproteobacteria bacterium]
MADKHYISAQQLLEDAFRLGLMVLRSGFRPGLILGIWRGGTPVGIAVQEILQVHGVASDHMAIRTALYTGIGQRARRVRVHGLAYALARLRRDTPLLLVDDVFDTGLSVEAVVRHIRRRKGRDTPAQIRIATPWYKPANNQTDLAPDYFIHQTGQWLVFPHELAGLSRAEVLEHKPGLRALYREFGL